MTRTDSPHCVAVKSYGATGDKVKLAQKLAELTRFTELISDILIFDDNMELILGT